MAKYPFDERFRLAVSNLPEWGGDGWNILINFVTSINKLTFNQASESDSRTEIIEANFSNSLTEAGYSLPIVAGYLEALQKLSTDDLIELALTDQLENSPALLMLERSTNRDVLEKAIDLCDSPIVLERALGVLVLMRKPGLTYREEAVQAITALTNVETDDGVVADIAYALCHLDVSDRLSFLLKAANSNDSATRCAAAYSLGDLSDEGAIECKIALTKDPVDDVRNWATFGLYLGLEGDQYQRQDVRDALFERLNDSHKETHYEAIEGLARCKDPRVVEPLIEALKIDRVWYSALESAETLAAPALHPYLVALKECWDESDDLDLLDKAIESCTPVATDKNPSTQ